MVKQKNVWLSIAGGVVLVALIWLVVYLNNNPKVSPEPNKDSATNSTLLPSAQDTPTETVTPSTPSSTPTTKVVQPVVSANDLYTNALKTYKYRIQFSHCHGVANVLGTGLLTVKKNTKFMLDNRDWVPHTFVFAGQKQVIGATGFLIASVAKAGTYNVTCDGGGAATLKIEN